MLNRHASNAWNCQQFPGNWESSHGKATVDCLEPLGFISNFQAIYVFVFVRPHLITWKPKQFPGNWNDAVCHSTQCGFTIAWKHKLFPFHFHNPAEIIPSIPTSQACQSPIAWKCLGIPKHLHGKCLGIS